MKIKQLVGLRFNRLLVLAEVTKRRNNKVYWDCQCDCGNLVTVQSQALLGGGTKSCGCKKAEDTVIRNKSNVKVRTGNEVCDDCNIKLNTSNWWPSWDKSNNTRCIPCGRKRNILWDTKDRAKDRKLRITFGITLIQYNQMLKNQNNKCSICYSEVANGKGAFHVDHCHTTGKIRGLLCHYCNVGLGNFKDNIATLANAIQYLKISREYEDTIDEN